MKYNVKAIFNKNKLPNLLVSLPTWVAIIAVVTVNRDKDYAHGLLTRAARWVENSRLDCELVDYEIELI